jgi:DNA polymerase III alpha subunit (gram-positive type)
MKHCDICKKSNSIIISEHPICTDCLKNSELYVFECETCGDIFEDKHQLMLYCDKCINNPMNSIKLTKPTNPTNPTNTTNPNISVKLTNHINTMIQYIVLDIETDGYDKIIQVAYNIYDSYFQLIKKCDHLINDKSGKVDFYRRISIDEIRTNGISPKSMLEILSNDMKNCNYIVGHNIIFDITKLMKYYNKYKIKCVFPEQLDTMKSSRTYVKALTINGRLKYPKLGELYHYLFNEPPDSDSCHRADYDVHITYQCFIELVKRNIININL